MKQFVRSLVHAARGILYTFRNERNFQVEVVCAFAVLTCIVWLPLSPVEASMLLFSIVLVLAFELLNTAVERVMDILKPRVHPYARVVKDVTAGAVFVVSAGALLIGMVILAPYLLV